GALMRFVEVRLSDEELTRHGVQHALPQGDDPFELIEGVLDLVPALHARARALAGELEATPPTSAQAGRLLRSKRWIDQLQARLATLAASVDDGDTEWVAETGRDAAGRTVAFRPVEVAGLADPLLFRFGERVLLMSATILDPATYLRALGIDPDRAAVIRAPSTFPPERRPIRLRPVARLTRHHLASDLPKLVAAVEQLLREHPHEKGVVHAHTYRIARAIADGLPPDLRPRLRTHASAADRDAALTSHLSDRGPTVLITPSMTEGIDLADDAARWQAICKVPYPYLGDPQVAARQAIDPAWYAWRTCLTVVQAYGRSVRGPNDRAVTYLLDASFPAFVRRERQRLPAWFLEAIEEPDAEDESDLRTVVGGGGGGGGG
ncbi:MAG: helicase C-terminal domain-containing protein, partial [Trueperaceae bacterium]